MGYYAALKIVNQFVESKKALSEEMIRHIHGAVMGGGKNYVKPFSCRDGQNVIRDGRSGGIVYLPPEAQDVSRLMGGLVGWLLEAENKGIPVPIRAAIAHYQFATIHPCYDGNGRAARLLTSLVLHQRGYGLQGIYSLEEYYAQDLQSYYSSLSVGPSHNYYFGREDAEITQWVEYFCDIRPGKTNSRPYWQKFEEFWKKL